MLSSPQNRFAAVAPPSIGRSRFDRSWNIKATMDGEYLYPLFVEEVLPGDTIQYNGDYFGRFLTLIFPIMDNVRVEGHFFFVPNRLVWDNWEKFCGAQDEPDDSTDFTVPVIDPGNDPPTQLPEGSIYDYMGLPTKVDLVWTVDDPDSTTKFADISSLPMRAYKLIWNEWYRDENLQNKVTLDKGDGPDDPATHVLLKRGKRKDYITSALPWPQKGEALRIPLGTSAPVFGNGTLNLTDGTTVYGIGYRDNTGFNGMLQALDGWDGQPVGSNPAGSAPVGGKSLGVPSVLAQTSLYADLSQATAATIEQWRQAMAFQSMAELDARGGTRYTEILRAHFRVSPNDARLQRPEYLGGFSQRIDIRQVAQTSQTQTDPGALSNTPQANLAAFGQLGAGCDWTKSFEEHGHVIGLFNITADLTYQQCIDRMWSRQTKHEFYWPSLAHLGEQAVLNQEVFFNPLDVDVLDEPKAVWGYQERWSEYKYGKNKVVGKFKSNATGSLHAWHLALNFTETPRLNAAFITDNPPFSRVVSITDEPYFMVDMRHGLLHTRAMPVYAMPSMLAGGRF